MARPLAALLTTLPLLAALGAAPPRPAWFPAEVGARWAYQSTAGQETTLVVTAVEEKGGAKVATIALLLEDGKRFPIQKVSASVRGLFQVWAYGADCTPPVCLLRLPPAAGQTWENRSVVANLPLREVVEVVGPEDVSTPAGTFRAFRVEADCVAGFGSRSRVATWYAPGVGMVKRVAGGEASALASFTRGGQAAGERQPPVIRSPLRRLTLGETLPPGRLAPDGKTLAPALTVSGVVLSPDGRTVAAGRFDSVIQLRDVRTGGELASLRQQAGGALSLAFSPDGSTLASGERDGTIRLWDLRPGKERATLKGQARFVHFLAFSPDGRTLASGGCQDGAVELWDVRAGKGRAALRGHAKGVAGVAFSPDGKTLASAGHDGKVRLWDVASGKEMGKLEVSALSVLAVAFSPDGKTLAAGCEDQSVRLWDVRTGKEQARLKGHSSWVQSVAFSPDGRTLASGSEYGPIKLWDLATGEALATLAGHTNRVVSLAFSPDGKTLASASLDQTALLWDATPPAKAGK